MLQSARQMRMLIEDVSQIGECRRAAQRLAESYGFDETHVGRVAIIATELATNVVRHAGRGEMLIQALDDELDVFIEMVAIDRGRGMHVETCMRDGYSTAGTAGAGLGAISRLSSLFDVYSLIDQGTVAVSRVSRGKKPTLTTHCGAICIALAGEIECGDTWRIAERGADIAIMVADGLGHGPLAAASSQAAAAAFMDNPFERPSEAMNRVHAKLGGMRGAAAAVALLDSHSRRASYAGVGNIAGSVISSERSKGMVSHNGTLGVQLLRSQQFDYELPPASRVVMHSDGMSARWSMNSYPGLFVRHAAVIAAVLYRDHARPRDDVTVVVAGGYP